MTRKSGRNFRRKATHGGVTSTVRFRAKNRHLRRRHKFKSQSHRLILTNGYFSRIKEASSSYKENVFPKYEFNTVIPENYNETYVYSLPVNPDYMFASWESIPEKTDGQIVLPQTGSKLILRLKKKEHIELVSEEYRELSVSANYQNIISDGYNQRSTNINFEVNKKSGDLYLKIPEPGEFSVELWKLTGDDEILIASSESVKYCKEGSGDVFNCISISTDCIDYFDSSKEQLEKKKVSEPDNTENINQPNSNYLGSAAYGI